MTERVSCSFGLFVSSIFQPRLGMNSTATKITWPAKRAQEICNGL